MSNTLLRSEQADTFGTLRLHDPMRIVCVALLALQACATTVWGAEEFLVPLMSESPKLDGRIDPKEWAASAGFDGFVTLNEGKLQRRRARGFVGATATHF